MMQNCDTEFFGGFSQQDCLCQPTLSFISPWFSWWSSSDSKVGSIDHDLLFGQLFKSVTRCLSKKRVCVGGGVEKKINRFPLSGWAVSLACQ